MEDMSLTNLIPSETYFGDKREIKTILDEGKLRVCPQHNYPYSIIKVNPPKKKGTDN